MPAGAGVRAELDSLRARLDTMVAMSGGTHLVVPQPRMPGASEGGGRGKHTAGGRPSAVSGTPKAIAWALELPVQARRRFRADSESVLAHAGKKFAVGDGMAAWHPAAKVSALWRADLADDVAWRYEYESRAWGYAALRWLLVDAGGAGGAGGVVEAASASESDAGTAGVAWLRATISEMAEVAKAASWPTVKRTRQALVGRLSTDADRLLRGPCEGSCDGPCEGSCDGPVNRELLAAAAEATLFVGSLTYACWPRSALAQAYFIQALALSQASGDRQQGVAILSAMSQQAAFCGQLDEERNLLKTALKGTTGNVTPGDAERHAGSR